MAIELSVNGLFDMTIRDVVTGVLVDRVTEKDILSKLQSGDMLISMNHSTIANIDTLNQPKYTFEIDVLDSTEYEFKESEQSGAEHDSVIEAGASNEQTQIVKSRVVIHGGLQYKKVTVEMAVLGYMGNVCPIYLHSNGAMRCISNDNEKAFLDGLDCHYNDGDWLYVKV